MDQQRLTALLSRIGPEAAKDLDDLLGSHDLRRGRPGRDVFPDVQAQLLPHTALKRADSVCVGFRVTAPLANPADSAARLAAFAAERDVEIIVLAETDASGLDRFGFRIERIVGDTPEARLRCEGQILRFWNIDLVL
jgi:D-serine deaminase-like pyridoxal phosphate-dependent protein